jgi:hypothetical protein
MTAGKPSFLDQTKMRPNKDACIGERASPIFEMSIPQLPRMNHVRPNLQRHSNIGCTRSRRKPGGVIE